MFFSKTVTADLARSAQPTRAYLEACSGAPSIGRLRAAICLVTVARATFPFEESVRLFASPTPQLATGGLTALADTAPAFPNQLDVFEELQCPAL